MKPQKIGSKQWVIPGGHIPFGTHGKEPEFTSHDRLSILNTSGKEADIEMMIYYEDRDPDGPYPICVEAQRMKEVRFNDLIDPLAIPLDTPYSCVLNSNVPVVVQFSRQDTRQTANAIATMMAWPVV